MDKLFLLLQRRVVSLSKQLNLQLEVVKDQCQLNHVIYVIRVKGDESGGLAIIHFDSRFNSEDAEWIVNSVNWEFLRWANGVGLLNDLAFVSIDRLNFLKPVFLLERLVGQDLIWDPSLNREVEMV